MLKNITLSADQKLIESARERARHEHTTLNAEFRRWLERYVNRNELVNNYEALMKELDYVRLGRKFLRDEMNER